MLTDAIFRTVTVLVSALAAAGCAVIYFKNIRMERPAVGVFNGRDVAVLLTFILILPLFYLILPAWGLTVMLTLTFTGALYIVLRPMLRPRYIWPLIFLLLGGNIWIALHYLESDLGWQVYWVFTSVVMMLTSAGVANLYVQGGMRLRHVAWFSFVLAGYDAFFIFVIPLSAQLADLFVGRPLDPSMGFRMGPYNANIGLGDLLVFCCYAIAAYKGFGRRGLISAFTIIIIFGALIPSISPLIISAVVRQGIGIAVPAQASFGPAALITYFLLSRRAKERSMKEWMALEAAQGLATTPGSRIVRRIATPALADVQGSVQGSD